MPRITFFSLLLAGLACLTQAAPTSTPPKLELSLPELRSQQTFRLSTEPARPTVVNFWTNGCAPCLGELRYFSQLALAHPEVRFLGVALDPRDSALKLLDDNALSFPNLLAPEDPRPLLRSFGNGIVAMPFTIILNPDRSRCWANLGELDRARFNQAFDYCALGHRQAATPARTGG